jgi:hypothetical protein
MAAFQLDFRVLGVNRSRRGVWMSSFTSITLHHFSRRPLHCLQRLFVVLVFLVLVFIFPPLPDSLESLSGDWQLLAAPKFPTDACVATSGNPAISRQTHLNNLYSTTNKPDTLHSGSIYKVSYLWLLDGTVLCYSERASDCHLVVIMKCLLNFVTTQRNSTHLKSS